MTDDVASTLKTGFFWVGLLLAAILIVLMTRGEPEEPVERGRNDRESGQKQSWTDALETRCRDIHERLTVMPDRFAQLDREYEAGLYTTAEAIAEQSRLSDEEARLSNQIYDTCAVNRDLWDYLRRTW